MRIIRKEKFIEVTADENKHIRSVNDVYTPEHTDEDGNIVEEHTPYYATVLYIPLSLTEEQIKEMYVEEDE